MSINIYFTTNVKSLIYIIKLFNSFVNVFDFKFINFISEYILESFDILF